MLTQVSAHSISLKNILGFSLIELLIALAIIGILVAMIYPSYTSHIQTSHREAAKIKLLHLAELLEEYNFEHHSYENATFAKLKFKPEDEFYYYKIKVFSDSFILFATPKFTSKLACSRLIYQSNSSLSSENGIICES